MERTLDVQTGESVTIRYELAGLGSRFLAVALDVTVQLTIAVAVVLVLAFALPGAVTLAGTLGQAAARAVLFFALFVLFFGYFIVFEGAWNGRTPGKRALGLRVVRDGGIPVDAGAAVVRNVIRVLEFALGFYAVSAVVALLSSSNKRLGDYAAGTVVVRERGAAAPIASFAPAEHPGDDGLDPAERGLIERYVLRRSELSAAAREEVAGAIAARVRPHLRASFDHLDDDALLVHLGRNAS